MEWEREKNYKKKPRFQRVEPGFRFYLVELGEDAFALGLGESRGDAIAAHGFEGAGRDFHFDKAAFFGHPDALGLQIGHLAMLGVAHRVRYLVASQRLLAGNFTTSGHSIFLRIR